MALFICCALTTLFANTKYLGSALGARTLIGRAPILHRDSPWVVHLHLLAALHTISLHSYLLFEDAMRLTRTH